MTRFIIPSLSAVLCFVLACGDDGRPSGVAGNDSSLVGGPCMNGSECDLGLCEPTSPLGEGQFPGGMCSSSCGSTSNCPSNSSCAELEGGWVCVTNCTDTSDCREQYSCQRVVEAGTNENSMVSVCLGDLTEG